MPNPNSQNQLWSRWTFRIRESGRHVPFEDVQHNAAQWLRAGFGSVGTARVRAAVRGWQIDLLVEGKPAHDPKFVADVQRQFQRNFVAKGWGPLAIGTVRVEVLAGSKQDGRPAAQLVVIPRIELEG